jgi:hypothetical protein
MRIGSRQTAAQPHPRANEKSARDFRDEFRSFLTMKLILILPFVAVILAGTATGQQAVQPTAKPVPVPVQRQAREPIPGEAPPPPASPPRREARLFVFPGGTPADFLAKVDKEFGSHFSEVATIPGEANRVRVPQIRAKLVHPADAIGIYNSLGASNKSIGNWQYGYLKDPHPIEGEMISPDLVNMVIFDLPAGRTPQASLDVRAISLRDIPEGKWKAFTELLNRTIAELGDRQASLDNPPVPFDLKIHPETGVLVAMGGKEQVERVETLAASMRASFTVRRETGDDGVKARAFSITGLPVEKLARVIEEMVNRSGELRGREEKLAEVTGTPVGAGVHIVGTPEVVESLQVLVVAGNTAGLEFAGSLIEEVKRAMEQGDSGKFVIVDGAVDSRGSVPWTPKLTVLDAIAAAGGLKGIVDPTIRLTRDGNTRDLSYKEIKYDPAKNERLQPRDHLEIGHLSDLNEKSRSAAPAKP